ncbi:hypothetical protein GHT06_008731 [Daphnia sinensis]|uniref:Uncharacterized protein n=1 Tax=Daphnia sinensis TaxID=1820382 RepID=A0AAD5Q2J8_9CRUS|nr:hypothetical protein GHT06_008731 [Daphnia sinensis]
MMMMRHHHHHQDRGQQVGKRLPSRSNDECNFLIRLDYYTQLVYGDERNRKENYVKYPTDLLHSSCEITDSLLQF